MIRTRHLQPNTVTKLRETANRRSEVSTALVSSMGEIAFGDAAVLGGSSG